MTGFTHLVHGMDINSPPGTKVKYVFPENGYPHDQEHGKKFLKLGETYTVKKTVIHKWSTDVWLEEVPETVFNSVLFAKVEK